MLVIANTSGSCVAPQQRDREAASRAPAKNWQGHGKGHLLASPQTSDGVSNPGPPGGRLGSAGARSRRAQAAHAPGSVDPAGQPRRLQRPPDRRAVGGATAGDGRHAELAGEVDALVREHPLRERLRGQLMLALYRCGRQADALQAYRDARAALVEELGIEPGRGLRELHQAILEQNPALDVAAKVEATPGSAGGFLVGREAELGELGTGLDDAFAGRGRLLLLFGEPGVGKSRLADELASRARARGARVLVGRCWEAGGAPAYWPWVQTLRAYVREADPAALRVQLGAGAGEIAQIVPELRELFSDLPAPISAESEAARFRLLDSTAAFLRAASAEQPLVLVLDDLHAADEPSLLMLRFLAGELGDSGVLLVGTFRDVDPTVRDPLEATLAELGRQPTTQRVALSGLDRAGV